MNDKLITECKLFVKELHKGQLDKGGNDYYHHLYEVADNAKDLCVQLKLNKDIDHCMLIGLLHDSIEDCSLSVEIIKEKYGNIVAEGVVLMTKKLNKNTIGGEIFNGSYIEYLVNLYNEYKNGNDVAKLAIVVKMADLKSNMNYKRLGIDDFDELNEKAKKGVMKYYTTYCLLMNIINGTLNVSVEDFKSILKETKYDESFKDRLSDLLT